MYVLIISSGASPAEMIRLIGLPDKSDGSAPRIGRKKLKRQNDGEKHRKKLVNFNRKLPDNGKIGNTR